MRRGTRDGKTQQNGERDKKGTTGPERVPEAPHREAAQAAQADTERDNATHTPNKAENGRKERERATRTDLATQRPAGTEGGEQAPQPATPTHAVRATTRAPFVMLDDGEEVAPQVPAGPRRDHAETQDTPRDATPELLDAAENAMALALERLRASEAQDDATRTDRALETLRATAQALDAASNACRVRLLAHQSASGGATAAKWIEKIAAGTS